MTPREFADALDAFRDEIPAAIQRTLVRVAFRAESQGKLNATQRLRVRTGRLRASIRGDVIEHQGAPAARLRAGGSAGGIDVAYAAAQEYGGTIRPKRSRFLAIPIGAALTGAGVGRRPSPRDYPGLFPIVSKRGNLLLVRRRGTGLEALFVLRRSVTLKGRRYLRDAVADAEAFMERALVEEIEKAMASAVAGAS